MDHRSNVIGIVSAKLDAGAALAASGVLPMVVKSEGSRRDIAQFLSLPIPQAVWERMKIYQNDALVRFIEEWRNWKLDAGLFSLVKFAASWKLLKTGAFTDQIQRMGSLLFSLLFSLFDF